MKKKIINFLNKVLKRYWLQIISNDYRYFKYWNRKNINKKELEVLSLIWIDYIKSKINKEFIDYISKDLLIASTTNVYHVGIDNMSISKELEIYIKIK